MLSIAFASFSLGRCPVSELLRPFQITERVLKINISSMCCVIFGSKNNERLVMRKRAGHA